MLTVFLYASLAAMWCAVVALAWSVVLVQEGMLLAPVRARIALWYYHRRGGDANVPGSILELQWWFKPLWGCAVCVSGQLALWGYVLLSPTYSLAGHVLCVSLALLYTTTLTSFYQWLQK